uniref:MAM domain-containing protein n=1 Tax=Heliothis virescens TaxID=7102 RepID=A0A2A4JET7_HELVI
MIGKVFILIVLVPFAFSDSCVRYTFEEDDFYELFTSSRGQCNNMLFWDIGRYEDLTLPVQNPSSTSFISPQTTISCVSSFTFPMVPGGRIDIEIYYREVMNPQDMIMVFANEIDEDGGDKVVGMVSNSPQDADFQTGWRTLPITVTGLAPFDGYITIMGMTHKESTVLVDAFRYIPPDMDESLCPFYDDIPEPITTTTTEETTTTTTEETTTTTEETTTTTEPTTTTTATDPTTTPDPTTIPEQPSTENPDMPLEKGFWNPLTITMAAVLLLILAALICYLFYECGRRRAKPIVIIDDPSYEDLPSTFKVPRVKNVIPEQKFALP